MCDEQLDRVKRLPYESSTPLFETAVRIWAESSFNKVIPLPRRVGEEGQ